MCYQQQYQYLSFNDVYCIYIYICVNTLYTYHRFITSDNNSSSLITSAYYSSLFIMISYHSLLFIIIDYHSLLFINIQNHLLCLLSFTIIHYCSFLMVHYSSLFTLIHYYSLLFSLFIFIVHFSSSHAGHRTIPHFWNNQNMHRCLQRWPCVFWMCLEGIGGTWWDP